MPYWELSAEEYYSSYNQYLSDFSDSVPFV